MGQPSRPSIRRGLIASVVATAAVLGGLLVPLSAQAAASVAIPDAVAQILADTNALRAAGGLAPLIESTQLDTVAQTWTATMSAAGALSHNPSYSSQIPLGWTAAGENVAAGYSATSVVEAWHNSPGHYANIMGSYNTIGIGYFEANGQTYFTQDFGRYATVPSPKAAPTATPSPSASPSGSPSASPSPSPSQSQASTQVPAVADSATSAAPTPVVSGNALLDSRTGKTLAVHAVNWPSFEYACQQGWGNSASGATAAAAAAMVSWGINAVRIPLNQDCWLGVDGAPKPPITVDSYKSALVSWVSTLNAAGLVAILDLHWTAPTGSAADGQRAMPDAQSTAFWTSAATLFANSKSVMFETFNEPYSRGSLTVSWSCWANGGCQVPVANDQTPIGTATYTAVGQATLVAAIRATGATQPILLDGLNYANDLTGWLANKPNDSQLVASWHNYPDQGCSDTSCWNAQIVPVTGSVPVIATEFGMTDSNPAFINGFMTWADAHGIGYAPWAWWVTAASDGPAANLYSLISNTTTFTPRAPEGTAYQAHLASLRPAVAPRNSPATSLALASYTDVLNRTPAVSDSGVVYWTSQINQGVSRGAIAASFNNSDEYRLLKINAAYADVLHRTPDAGGQLYWLQLMQAGLIQPDDVHRAFLSSNEFYSVQGGGTNVGYVSALYTDIIGRAPDGGGLGYWLSVLSYGGRGAVVNGLWFADETFRVRVAQAYVGLLGRPATLGDQIYWAGVAQQVGLTVMRTMLMSSDEYWIRAQSRFP